MNQDEKQIKELPWILWLKILAMVNIDTLMKTAKSSQYLYNISLTQSLWKQLCYQNKWRLSEKLECKQIEKNMFNGEINWRVIFSQRYKLLRNWQKCQCKRVTLYAHLKPIMCVALDNNYIVSTSLDHTLKVWEYNDGKLDLIFSLDTAKSIVRALHFKNKELVFGSSNKIIEVWKISVNRYWKSFKCVQKIHAHTAGIRCLDVTKDKIVSGSPDRTLKIWNKISGTWIATLEGHLMPVTAVACFKNLIVSGSADKTIRVWNFTDFSCNFTVQAHDSAINTIKFDDDGIITGSLDYKIKIWIIEENQITCKRTIDYSSENGCSAVIRAVHKKSWRVASSGDGNKIKLWNIRTGELLSNLCRHFDGVTCLDFDETIMISGSYDTCIKICDFGSDIFD